MENISDFIDRCDSLPNNELRKLYLSKNKCVKWLSRTPIYILVISVIVVCLLFVGIGAAYIVVPIFKEYYINLIGFAISGVIMASIKGKAIWFDVVAYFIFAAIKFSNGDGNTADILVSLIPTAYLILANIKVLHIQKEMEYLKTLPDFPFNERNSDRKLEGMTNEQLLRYMETEKNGGIYAPNFEKIFDEKSAKPIKVQEENQNEKFETFEQFEQAKQNEQIEQAENTDITENEQIEQNQQDDEIERILPPDADWISRKNQ